MITEEKKTYRSKISIETANIIINYLYKSLPEGCNNYYLNVMNNNKEFSLALSGIAKRDDYFLREYNFGAHICVLPYEEKELKEDGTKPFQHYDERQYYYITTLQCNGAAPYIQLREDLLHFWSKYNPTKNYHILAIDKNGLLFDLSMYDITSKYLSKQYFKHEMNTEGNIIDCFYLDTKSVMVSNQPHEKRSGKLLVEDWNSYMGHFNYAQFKAGKSAVIVSYNKDGSKRKAVAVKSISMAISMLYHLVDTKGKDEKHFFDSMTKRFQRNKVFTLKGNIFDFIISGMYGFDGPEKFEKLTVKIDEEITVNSEVKYGLVEDDCDVESLASEALEDETKVKAEDEISEMINTIEKPAPTSREMAIRAFNLIDECISNGISLAIPKAKENKTTEKTVAKETLPTKEEIDSLVEDMNTEDEIQKEINKLNSIPEEKPAVSEKSEIQKRLEAEVNANKYVYDFKTERQKLLGEQKRYVDEANHIPTTEELSELVAMI